MIGPKENSPARNAFEGGKDENREDKSRRVANRLSVLVLSFLLTFNPRALCPKVSYPAKDVSLKDGFAAHALVCILEGVDSLNSGEVVPVQVLVPRLEGI
jgi:hypothetical protein